MRWERRGLAMLAMAGCLAASAPGARAQGMPDSVVTGVPSGVTDTVSAMIPRYVFSPIYTNRITGDVSSVGMANEFRTNFTTPWGSLFSFQLSGEEKNYRLQNRLEDNKRMNATLMQTFRPGLTGSVSYLDSRVFNRSIAVGGGVQDFIFNDLSLAGGLGYVHRLEALRLDATVSGSAVNGERAFKTDETLAAGISGGVRYALLNQRVSLEGRAGLKGTNERSTTSDSTFTGLGASEDSLLARARIEVSDSIRFSADHVTVHGERAFADQARGSLGGQIGGAENVFEENEVHDVRNTTLTMVTRLPGNLGINLTAYHDENVFDYEIQKTRFSNTVADGFRGTVTYLMPWKTTANVGFEGSNTLRDLGPQSVSSLTDKRKLFRLGLSHRFSNTFSVDLNGSTQLLQSFYLDYEANPRDRDQVDTSVNMRITSRPYAPMVASISLAYSASEFINIDATQSENNRTRDLYELRPSFTYTVNTWFTIVQTYGVAIEYTDFIYKSADNFLDRNLIFSNEFQFVPTPAVRFRFEYGLHVHDTGSYLPDEVTGEELLTVEREDRRERLTLRVDYRLNPHLGVFGDNYYSSFTDRTIATESETVTTDGQIRVGTTGDYDWGKGRKLTFQVARVKRFSAFGADAEKNYWDARSEFTYPF
jgi:hypothetical protein